MFNIFESLPEEINKACYYLSHPVADTLRQLIKTNITIINSNKFIEASEENRKLKDLISQIKSNENSQRSKIIMI